jgi:RNA-directed DNA polymerase
VNTDAPWPDVEVAWGRVLGIQIKLHQWAGGDADRRFDDLYNLVCDPAFLVVAWDRVRGNRGARSAGVDGQTARYIEAVRGRDLYLADLRAELKARTFMPLPVRERVIPKASGKLRRLGIPTVRDRVAQAAPKAGARADLRGGLQARELRVPSEAPSPGRHRRDPPLHGRSYEWVVEGDITACFDEIDHTALMGRGATSGRGQARPGPGEGVPRNGA